MATLESCDVAIRDLEKLIAAWDARRFPAIAEHSAFSERRVIRDCLKLAKALRAMVTEVRDER
jgi:hypothetical protein